MPVDTAIARCEEIIAESGRDPLTEAVAANALALSQRNGRPFRRGAGAQRRAAVRSSRISGSTLMLPTLDAWTGQAEMLAGDPRAAERLWRRAYQALEGLGEKGNLSTIAAYLAEALYEQERYDEAEELTTVSESMTFPDDVTSQIAWRTVRAKVVARKGDLDLAEVAGRGRRRQGGGDGLASSPRRCIGSARRGAGRQGSGRRRCGDCRRGASAIRDQGKRGCSGRPTRPLRYLAVGPSPGRLAPRPSEVRRASSRAGGLLPRAPRAPRARSPAP